MNQSCQRYRNADDVEKRHNLTVLRPDPMLYFPTGGLVNIARRQGTDTIHMIRQRDPAIDMKRSRRSNLTHRRAQCVDLVDEHMRFTFEQINGEELRSTRITISAVVGDERILPEQMSAYDGRRCAFPYGPQHLHGRHYPLPLLLARFRAYASNTISPPHLQGSISGPWLAATGEGFSLARICNIA